MSQNIQDQLDRDEKEIQRKIIDNGQSINNKNDDIGSSRISPMTSQIKRKMENSKNDPQRKRNAVDSMPHTTETRIKSHRKETDDIASHREEDTTYWNQNNVEDDDNDDNDNNNNNNNNNDDDDDDDRPVMDIIRDQRRVRSEEIKRISHSTENKKFDSNMKPTTTFYSSDDNSSTKEQRQSATYLGREGGQIPPDGKAFLAVKQSANSSSGRPPLGPMAIGTGTRTGTGTGTAIGTEKRADIGKATGVSKYSHSRDSGMKPSGTNSSEVLYFLEQNDLSLSVVCNQDCV